MQDYRLDVDTVDCETLRTDYPTLGQALVAYSDALDSVDASEVTLYKMVDGRWEIIQNKRLRLDIDAVWQLQHESFWLGGHRD